MTELAQPKWEGLKWLGVTDREFDVGVLGEKQFPEGATLPEMEGNLMGMPGSVRLLWWPDNQPRAREWSGWLEVDSNGDFTRNVTINGLKADQLYELEVESRSASGRAGQSLTASFRTAPGPRKSDPLHFVVSTCQSWVTRDKGTAGIHIYDHMLDLDPDFFVHLGDIVYYDKKSAGGDVDALT